MNKDIILIPAMDWREVRIPDPESSYECVNGEHSFMPPIADGSEHEVVCRCGETKAILSNSGMWGGYMRDLTYV